MNENEIGGIVVDCAVKVHMRLVPGLLEIVYEAVLSYESQNKGLLIQKQVPIPITYDNLLFTEAFCADLIVDDKVHGSHGPPWEPILRYAFPRWSVGTSTKKVLFAYS